MVLTNNGTTPINAWTIKWTFADAQQMVTQLWNGTVTQTGTQVTVTNANYNGSIPPGGTVTFGFNGSWGTINPIPTSITVNGIAASVN